MKTKRSRREFLRVSAAGALGAFAISKSNWDTLGSLAGESPVVDLKSFGIGLQLYTIREAMKADVPGSLKKVSDTGYKYVELADYGNRKFYGYEPTEFRKLVNDLGMEILSSHAGIDPKGDVTDEASRMAEDHAKLGVKYCMHPYISDGDRTLDDYHKLVDAINKTGRDYEGTWHHFRVSQS